VAVAGGGAAEVEPVTVVTSGTVSVKEMVPVWSEVEELSDETALETEIERLLLDDDSTPEATVVNAVLLAWLAMLDDSDVATGSVVCDFPGWHEIRAKPSAAASLQKAVLDKVMLKKRPNLSQGREWGRMEERVTVVSESKKPRKRCWRIDI